MKTKISTRILALLFGTASLNAQIEMVQKSDSLPVSNITATSNNLYFTSSTRDSAKIWVLNGTSVLAKMLKKMRVDDMFVTVPSCFTKFNNDLVFFAEDSFGYDKQSNYLSNPYLWKTDGTVDGTVKLAKVWMWEFLDDDYPRYWGKGIIQSGDKLFFGAKKFDGTDYEMWISDGSPEGTEVLTEYLKKAGGEINYTLKTPSYLVSMNGSVFFAADDGVHGEKLWVTNGTAAGTHMVNDAIAGADNGLGYYYIKDTIVSVGNKIFFTSLQNSIWVNDGTETGTKKISKYDYTKPSEDTRLFIYNLTGVNGQLYFNVGYWNFTKLAFDSVQLWKTDGTETGTAEVKDVTGWNIGSTANYKSNLVFTKYDSDSIEIWKVSGNNIVSMVKRVKYSEGSTKKLFTANDSLYFVGVDKDNVLKIFKSDGTADNTTALEPWNGDQIVSINDLCFFKDGIYFSAKHQEYGNALFKVKNGVENNIPDKVKEKTSVAKLEVSPNPASVSVLVKCPEELKGKELSVYNLQGVRVQSILIPSAQSCISLDLSFIKAGTYILTVTGKSSVYSTILIKK